MPDIVSDVAHFFRWGVQYNLIREGHCLQHCIKLRGCYGLQRSLKLIIK